MSQKVEKVQKGESAQKIKKSTIQILDFFEMKALISSKTFQNAAECFKVVQNVLKNSKMFQNVLESLKWSYMFYNFLEEPIPPFEKLVIIHFSGEGGGGRIYVIEFSRTFSIVHVVLNQYESKEVWSKLIVVYKN